MEVKGVSQGALGWPSTRGLSWEETDRLIGGTCWKENFAGLVTLTHNNRTHKVFRKGQFWRNV